MNNTHIFVSAFKDKIFKNILRINVRKDEKQVVIEPTLEAQCHGHVNNIGNIHMTRHNDCLHSKTDKTRNSKRYVRDKLSELINYEIISVYQVSPIIMQRDFSVYETDKDDEKITNNFILDFNIMFDCFLYIFLIPLGNLDLENILKSYKVVSYQKYNFKKFSLVIAEQKICELRNISIINWTNRFLKEHIKEGISNFRHYCPFRENDYSVENF